MHTQVKANIPLCRHGMRDDCPVQQCHFRHANPSLYSSVLKGPVATRATPGPTNPTMTNGSFAQGHQFEMHDDRSSEAYYFQRAKPSIDDSAAPLFSHASSTNMTVGTDSVGPTGAGANGLEQAADQLAIYRAWLESQVMAQKAKIQAMSSQYAIPIPNLDSNTFQLPSLSPMPPVASAESTIAAKAITAPKNNGCSVPAAPAPTPAAPRLQPAQPVPGSWPSRGMPHHAQAVASGPFYADTPVQSRPPPLHQQPSPVAPAGVVFQRPPTTSTAPKKEDMAYKTTPCRHFTLNQGWCPYGDGCGFIHDPELEWAPVSERTSGRSTPSSATLVGNRPVLPDKTAAESSADPPLSVSSKGAHCWGYIQGVCPHSEKCRYLHPADIVPYIKYTPCLTWPRCGYPAHACPLKHPQVDKLTVPPPSQRSSVPIPRAIPAAPRPQASVVAPRAQTSARTPLPPPAPAPPSTPMPPAFIIPHEEAYAHAKLHHRPTVPSAETFSPAPTRPAVRLRHPSEDAAQLRAAAPAPPCAPGPGVREGRARRVSIAVQRLDAEFAGAALHARVRGAAKGHGRGKSMNL